MHELLTTTEMAACDRAAVTAGVASLDLMERAGAAVAAAACRLLAPGGRRILVLAGPGNNGGDGFVAARLLAADGFDVTVAAICPDEVGRGDAGVMRSRWHGSVKTATVADMGSADLIIDAMFGAGLSRAPSGPVADIIGAVNGSGRPVLAVDVPSGLDGTSGLAPGAAIAATETVTFFRKKPGHLLMPGRALCGTVTTAGIGIPEHVLEAMAVATFENLPALWLPVWPHLDPANHKYHRGHAVVVSGPAYQTGAARLGARGALRVGAGLVTLAGSAAATAVNAAHATAVMVKVVPGAEALAKMLHDARYNTVLIGPGAGSGTETARDVLASLSSGAAVVLDADALTAFACSAGGGSEHQPARSLGFVRVATAAEVVPATLFAAIAERKNPVVLTPHDGEFRRLFGTIDGSKLDRAKTAARRSGAVIVLKGADTVIAAPDGRAAINGNAPPTLATAGAGDVLAGFITGLLAQGMAAFEAAAAAVWLHGECAAAFGPGLIAEDLPELLPRVLKAHGLGLTTSGSRAPPAVT
jgi:ADP-dependent NAD(P)H-hydrate dehydratase / NAD(P)H-hydrate epimerase